jgi:hypothetical protein
VPVLVLCAAGCASTKSRRGAREAPSAGEQGLEQRAEEAEARVREQREVLRRKEEELRQSFQAMARAESAAGLGNLGCALVMPASEQMPGVPRSGAVYARFNLRRQPYRMTASFAAPRASGGWRVSQGTCQVGSP